MRPDRLKPDPVALTWDKLIAIAYPIGKIVTAAIRMSAGADSPQPSLANCRLKTSFWAGGGAGCAGAATVVPGLGATGGVLILRSLGQVAPAGSGIRPGPRSGLEARYRPLLDTDELIWLAEVFSAPLGEVPPLSIELMFV